jgi:hypothetical protein
MIALPWIGVDMMDERRRLERVHLVHYLQLYLQEGGDFIGNLVDISPEGIKFISDQSFPLMKDLGLRMLFPEEIQGKKEINFTIQTVWCSVDNPLLYATGARVIDLKADDRKVIEFLIEWYRDSEKT